MATPSSPDTRSPLIPNLDRLALFAALGGGILLLIFLGPLDGLLAYLYPILAGLMGGLPAKQPGVLVEILFGLALGLALFGGLRGTWRRYRHTRLAAILAGRAHPASRRPRSASAAEAESVLGAQPFDLGGPEEEELVWDEDAADSPLPTSSWRDRLHILRAALVAERAPRRPRGTQPGPAPKGVPQLTARPSSADNDPDPEEVA